MAGGVGVTIGGEALSETAHRVNSISIARGRQDELDRTQTGTCTVDLTYSTRRTGTVGDWIGESGTITLSSPTGGTGTIFVGTVDDISYDLHASQQFTRVSVTLVDALDFFAGIEIAPGLHGVVPLPAGVDEGNIFYEQAIPQDRINTVILETNFAGGTEVFTGNVQVKDTVYAPRTSALTVIDDACDAEFPGVANRFIARDGTFVFHGRLARFNPGDPQYRIATYQAGDKAACVASPPRARIAGLRLGSSKQRIINAAMATPEGIADADIAGQIVTDAGSIAQYGVKSWSAENLLTLYDELNDIEANAAVLQFAQYYVDNYASPQIRIEELTLKSRHPDWDDASETWNMLCNVDISDLVDVQVSNPGVSVNGEYFVEGVRYSIQPMNEDFASVTMNLDLSPRAYWSEGF